MIKTVLLLGLAALVLSAAPAQSQVTMQGQPFCAERDELREYVLAALQNDQQWMASLKRCTSVKRGLKFVTIERENSGGDTGLSVSRVRIFAPNGSTLLGYMLTKD